MDFIACASPKGMVVLAVLVRNRASIVAILVSNGVWFSHASLELGLFIR